MSEILAIRVTPYPVILDSHEKVPLTIEVAALEVHDLLSGELVGPEGTELRIPLSLRRKDEEHWIDEEAMLTPEAPTGLWTVLVQSEDDSLEVQFPVESDAEKDRTELLLDLDPSVAEYGQQVLLRGRLAVPAGRRTFVQEVALLFRAEGDDVTEEVGSVKTDAQGAFLVGVPAEFSGSWSARFDGAEALQEAREEVGESAARAVMSARSAERALAVTNAVITRVEVSSFKIRNEGHGRQSISGSAVQVSPSGTVADLNIGTAEIAPKGPDGAYTGGDEDFTRQLNNAGEFKRSPWSTSKTIWYARVRTPDGPTSGWRKAKRPN